MTSMPASRRARQTTLTPLSWPSRPTLPMRTRMRRASVDGMLDITAPLLHQRIHDLAATRVGTHGVDGRRHDVGIRIASHSAKIRQRPGHGGVVALGLDLPQPLDLALLNIRRKLMQPCWRRLFVRGGVPILVHADVHVLAAPLGLLDVPGRVGDLHLLEVLLYS